MLREVGAGHRQDGHDQDQSHGQALGLQRQGRDEGLDEHDDQDRHHDRVQHHQHGYGLVDDGAQALVGQQEADERADHGIGNVADAREDVVEELGHSSHEAHRGGQARQRDDDTEQHAAEFTKGAVGGGGEQVGPQVLAPLLQIGKDGGIHGQTVAEPAQTHIDDGQRGGGHDTGQRGLHDELAPLGRGEHGFIQGGHAAVTLGTPGQHAGPDGGDDDDRERDRGQHVHGEVAVDEAVQIGSRAGGLDIRQRRRTPPQPKGRLADERQDAHQQHRREDGANALDHLGGVEAEPQRDAVIDQAEDQQRGAARLAQEGHHGHFIRGGAGARDGEEGPDGEVDDCQEEQREPRVDAVERGAVAVLVIGTDNDAQQRQAHARGHEAQQCRPERLSAFQAQCRGEDEVPGAKEDGEQHEADDESILVHCHEG